MIETTPKSPNLSADALGSMTLQARLERLHDRRTKPKQIADVEAPVLLSVDLVNGKSCSMFVKKDGEYVFVTNGMERPLSFHPGQAFKI